MPTTIDSWTQDPSTRCENAVVVFRILIVDDSSDLAGALSRLLQRRGHRVECAQTGAEALRLAHAFQPEFVMVDGLAAGSQRLRNCRNAARCRQFNEAAHREFFR